MSYYSVAEHRNCHGRFIVYEVSVCPLFKVVSSHLVQPTLFHVTGPKYRPTDFKHACRFLRIFFDTQWPCHGSGR